MAHAGQAGSPVGREDADPLRHFVQVWDGNGSGGARRLVVGAATGTRTSTVPANGKGTWDRSH